jgi:hypothetical protein
MKIPFTGGCMCGAIRYECSTEPLAMGICHCRDCQRATGSAFAAALMLPRNAVTIIGELMVPHSYTVPPQAVRFVVGSIDPTS